MKSSFLYLALTTLLILSSSCARGPIGLRFGDEDSANNNNEKPSDMSGVDTSGPTIGFAEVNEKVFSKYCEDCHQGEKLPLLVTYQDYKNESAQIFTQVVTLKKMPKRKTMTAEEIALVAKWIAQGTNEKGSEPEETTTTTTTTTSTTTTSSTVTTTTVNGTAPLVGFAEVNEKVFSQYCEKCHLGDEEPYLSSYQDYKNESEKIFKQVVTLQKMPRKKKLTPEEIDLVARWITQGANEKGSETPGK